MMSRALGVLVDRDPRLCGRWRAGRLDELHVVHAHQRRDEQTAEDRTVEGACSLGAHHWVGSASGRAGLGAVCARIVIRSRIATSAQLDHRGTACARNGMVIPVSG